MISVLNRIKYNLYFDLTGFYLLLKHKSIILGNLSSNDLIRGFQTTVCEQVLSFPPP
jgi:hypothetical protein